MTIQSVLSNIKDFYNKLFSNDTNIPSAFENLNISFEDTILYTNVTSSSLQSSRIIIILENHSDSTQTEYRNYILQQLRIETEIVYREATKKDDYLLQLPNCEPWDHPSALDWVEGWSVKVSPLQLAINKLQVCSDTMHFPPTEYFKALETIKIFAGNKAGDFQIADISKIAAKAFANSDKTQLKNLAQKLILAGNKIYKVLESNFVKSTFLERHECLQNTFRKCVEEIQKSESSESPLSTRYWFVAGASHGDPNQSFSDFKELIEDQFAILNQVPYTIIDSRLIHDQL